MTDELSLLNRATGRTLRFGLGLVLALLAFGGGWATLARIDGAVIGAGSLEVDGAIKTVQPANGGTIRDILVAEGDRVTAGELLVRLDETAHLSALGVIDVRLATLAIRMARLAAEAAGDQGFTPPAAAELHLDPAAHAAAVAGEQALFAARQTETEGQRRQIREQIAQIERQADGLRSVRATALAQAELARGELKLKQDLLDRGLTTRNAVLTLRQALIAAEGDAARSAAGLAGAEANLAEARERLAQVDRDFQSKVAADRRDAEAQMAELRENRAAAEAQLAADAIRAPVDGYVHQMKIHTLGGVVAAGAPLMSIVPADARLVAEVQVDPREIDEVGETASASVRILAGNQRLAPTLSGTVAAVDRDVTVEEATKRSFYRVRVALDGAAEARPDLSLMAGMPIEAFVATRSRSPLSFLMEPLMEQIDHAWRER